MGLNLIAPDTIFLSKDTKFGKNVVIEPYVVIGPKVKIGNNVIIKSFSHLEGTILKKQCSNWTVRKITNGTSIFSGAKIGNFVETKKTSIKSNSKVNHLSYVGDTLIGRNSNIGAGTITCNYDGIKKIKQN